MLKKKEELKTNTNTNGSYYVRSSTIAWHTVEPKNISHYLYGKMVSVSGT